VRNNLGTEQNRTGREPDYSSLHSNKGECLLPGLGSEDSELRTTDYGLRTSSRTCRCHTPRHFDRPSSFRFSPQVLCMYPALGVCPLAQNSKFYNFCTLCGGNCQEKGHFICEFGTPTGKKILGRMETIIQLTKKYINFKSLIMVSKSMQPYIFSPEFRVLLNFRNHV